MAWLGTGLVWTMRGGILTSACFGQDSHDMGMHARPDLSFVQISDSHIGFSKEANQNVVGTMKEGLAKIAALPMPPAFLLHTGDISHLSKPEEFDTASQLIREAGIGHAFFVPGEHDVLNDEGKLYRERYGKGTRGNGWYSFNQKGVHFIGLVNVMNLKAGGLGSLGEEQLSWLENDVKSLGSSTPIVVFAHIPLWSVYPEWGWGTEDSARALGYLKRFGSVTVLNGHIHQILQKVEGHITFHTAMSTAFTQPKPGEAPSPGPMKVPADKLRSVLGITRVNYLRGKHPLAVIDTPLSSDAPAEAEIGQSKQVTIDNFRFSPQMLTVPAGAKVTWVNHDDIPHTVVDLQKRFESPALDTDQAFSYTFRTSGEYAYFCSLHPKMTARIVVK